MLIKKSKKNFLLIILNTIICFYFCGCSNITPSQNLPIKEMWWVGIYNFVDYYIVGKPNNNESILIYAYQYECPKNTFNNRLTLNDDYILINTQWGCQTETNNKTEYAEYIIENSFNQSLHYGNAEQILIIVFPKNEQEKPIYYTATREGDLIYWIMGSDNFLFGFKLKKLQ